MLWHWVYLRMKFDLDLPSEVCAGHNGRRWGEGRGWAMCGGRVWEESKGRREGNRWGKGVWFVHIQLWLVRANIAGKVLRF